MKDIIGTAMELRELWYGPALAALGERRLPDEPKATGLVCRLAWLPSFRPNVIVRIEGDGTRYRLEAKKGHGTGRSWANDPVCHVAFTLTDEEREIFHRRFADAGYWHLPTVSSSARGRLDGTTWVLEAIGGGRHHIVERWMPDAAGPDAGFRALGEWMLSASRLAAA